MSKSPENGKFLKKVQSKVTSNYVKQASSLSEKAKRVKETKHK